MISCSTGTALVKPRTNIFQMIQRIHLTPFSVMPNQNVLITVKHTRYVTNRKTSLPDTAAKATAAVATPLLKHYYTRPSVVHSHLYTSPHTQLIDMTGTI